VLASYAPVTPAQAQAAAPVGKAEDGAKKVAMCQGCHGIPGWKTAFPEVYHVPRIAGQHQQYLVSALKAYKNGERPNETMRSIAVQLTDKDMADLAAYYGKPAGAAAAAAATTEAKK
jgi:cytochrome c553